MTGNIANEDACLCFGERRDAEEIATDGSSWQITVSDSTFASGYCGLRMLAQNGATATYTSFQATAQ